LTGRHPNLKFAPGALAAMFLSTDARTFALPPPAWTPGGRTRADIHGGSNQSLIGDLVRSGVTGVAGQVAEPLINGAVRPDILFPAYLNGANLAEAFYLAIPNLSWQTVVIGDPLASPFGESRQSTGDLDPPLDPATELPGYFSARRQTAMRDVKLFGTSETTRQLVARAESRQARSDREGAIKALEKAVKLEPAALQPWRTLAALYENASRHADAGAAYRQLLGLDQNDIVALNNLAYHLATREDKPQEALDYASRAWTLSNGSAVIGDTLGWTYHLLGNDQEALPYLVRASRILKRNAEVQFHAATVFAALGRLDDAARALDTAAALDPQLAGRADFQELRKKTVR
jgi:Flp pilus assembly protein TadD